MPAGPLLYVHPYNHVLDELVPMGAVALVNRAAVPKRGRYAWELTEADLDEAGCLAMDLHWYFSIEAVRWIAADVKARRPDLPIVLGGITASFYARYLVEHFPVDFVVQGDGELSFPRLVEALCAGRRPPPLANVWTRAGPPPSTSPVPAEVYDDNDYLDLSWFPTLQADTRAAHQEYAAAPFWGRMDRYHPYLPLNRGCRFPCGVCFGSWQRDVFGPGQVDRSVASVARLLDAVEAHPDYRFVNLTAGTEDMLRFAALREALGRRRPLGAYLMHFCALPSDAELQLLLDAFDRVCIDFTNPEEVPLPLRAAGMDVARAQERIEELCLALDGEERIRIGVSFMSTAPHPWKDRLRARCWQRLELKENSEWALPRPDLRTLEGGPEPAAREAAKARQAEGFREVSRGHARYLAARALSPGLYPLLDQSVLQRVDGAPAVALDVAPGPVADWLDAYTRRFRRWHVTTLAQVEVVLCPTGDAVDEAGLRPVRTWGPDLGLATLRESFDGLRLSWAGQVPEGASGLVLRARLQAEPGRVLDPRDVEGLPHLVLPLRGARALVLAGTLSAAQCAVTLSGEGRTLSGWHWIAARTLPPTPFDAAAPEPALARGPTDKVQAPWTDAALPPRLAAAVAAAVPAPWQVAVHEASPRWVHLGLDHPAGGRVHAFLLPPGVDPCAHATALGRLLLQREGVEDSPFQALARALVAALDAAAREAA